MSDALTPMPDGVPGDSVFDYQLSDGHRSVWITVGNISVHVLKIDEEELVVNLYAHGCETESPMATSSALQCEAKDMIRMMGADQEGQDEQLPESIADDGSIAVQNPKEEK